MTGRSGSGTGGASEAAVEAARDALINGEDVIGVHADTAADVMPAWTTAATNALDAAHDAALGPDRSVRLGDVVNALQAEEKRHLMYLGSARFIAREFGAALSESEAETDAR